MGPDPSPEAPWLHLLCQHQLGIGGETHRDSERTSLGFLQVEIVKSEFFTAVQFLKF